MADSEVAEAVSEALAVDADEYHRRVREDGERIKSAIDDGVFDNPQAIVGFEYEFYAADRQTDALRRVPRRLLEYIGFEKELGLHNAEMSTSPQPLNRYGLLAQEYEIKGRLAAALDATRAEGMTLVSDGMWTISPVGEPADRYLLDAVDDEGLRLATNMSASARYHAMANAEGEVTPAMRLSLPNVTLSADTVMPESLITSIQPHYQVPQARDLPHHFNYALRIAGPLLALGANSPLFPPELYDSDDLELVLSDHWMASRIPVFEQMLNPAEPSRPDRPHEGKVRFPRDLESLEDAVDRIVGDDVLVPVPVERSDRYDDRFAHFRRKHGTFWRWVRPVFGGPTRSAANARIEFRPIGGQPTVRDSVAFLAVFAGLMESLPRREHPVIDLEWAEARDNFYRAARFGLDADLEWIDADGSVAADRTALYDELFDHARDGLELRGLSSDAVNRYIEPLRWRVERGRSPASWKVERVRTIGDQGASLETAIHEMQHEYCERQRRTLLEGTFERWFDG